MDDESSSTVPTASKAASNLSLLSPLSSALVPRDGVSNELYETAASTLIARFGIYLEAGCTTNIGYGSRSGEGGQAANR